MEKTNRWFWVGSRPEVQDALTAALGSGPTDASVADAADGDMVVVDPQADTAVMAAMPHGHAFSGVRALKLRRAMRAALAIS